MRFSFVLRGRFFCAVDTKEVSFVTWTANAYLSLLLQYYIPAEDLLREGSPPFALLLSLSLSLPHSLLPSSSLCLFASPSATFFDRASRQCWMSSRYSSSALRRATTGWLRSARLTKRIGLWGWTSKTRSSCGCCSYTPKLPRHKFIARGHERTACPALLPPHFQSRGWPCHVGCFNFVHC